jgi:hypothetical protein
VEESKNQNKRKNSDFLRSTIFKLLNLMKENSVNYCDSFKTQIPVMAFHCNYVPQEPKCLATPLTFSMEQRPSWEAKRYSTCH